jgi:hypothetical protein
MADLEALVVAAYAFAEEYPVAARGLCGLVEHNQLFIAIGRRLPRGEQR